MSTPSKDLTQRLLEKSRPVSFQKTIGLLGAATLGIGALMGAGLYVLVGIGAGQAGPGLWAAYVVCGLLTFLSVLMFADFSARLPISGGGYVYAYRNLGSFWGFMVGWHLAVGSIFACALYAVGFASYAGSFLPGGLGGSGLVVKALAATLVALLTLLGLGGGAGGDRLQRVFTWGNLVVLVVLVAASVGVADPARLTPAFPHGAAGVGAAISLIYISFFGYQLIANSAEEIRDARVTVPRAMILSMVIAFVFYLTVALVAVAVVDWQTLAQSDAPLTLVASRGLGRWGAVLIGVGGILASGAALNGTLFSQGRQIYAMGRDRLLPGVLGTVRGAAKVPFAALVVGGLATIAVVLTADLSFIAKSANFALLFSMLPVSVALHRLHQGQPEGSPPVVLWRRAVPWAALVANTGLILTLDAQSLLFGGVMVGAGCVMFLGYSYSAEKRGQAGFSVALTKERGMSFLRRGERVLVPMANPRTQGPLFSIARSLMPRGGEIVVLNAVLAEGELSPREVLAHTEATHEALSVIRRAMEMAEAQGVTFRPVVRAVRNLPEGIVHTALEEACQLVIMGWSMKDASSPSRLLEEVVAQIRTDIIFLALKGDDPFQRIGVSLGGTSNLSLMVRVASTMAEDHRGDVVYLNVMPEIFDREHLDHARAIQIEAITRHTTVVPYRTEILRSDNPLEAIVERTRDLDLLVVGSAQVGALKPGSLGTFSSMVASQAHCSVIIVRHISSLGRIIPAQAEDIRRLGEDVIRRGARALPGRDRG